MQQTLFSSTFKGSLHVARRCAGGMRRPQRRRHTARLCAGGGCWSGGTKNFDGRHRRSDWEGCSSKSGVGGRPGQHQDVAGAARAAAQARSRMKREGAAPHPTMTLGRGRRALGDPTGSQKGRSAVPLLHTFDLESIHCPTPTLCGLGAPGAASAACSAWQHQAEWLPCVKRQPTSAAQGRAPKVGPSNLWTGCSSAAVGCTIV